MSPRKKAPEVFELSPSARNEIGRMIREAIVQAFGPGLPSEPPKPAFNKVKDSVGNLIWYDAPNVMVQRPLSGIEEVLYNAEGVQNILSVAAVIQHPFVDPDESHTHLASE